MPSAKRDFVVGFIVTFFTKLNRFFSIINLMYIGIMSKIFLYNSVN